MALKYQSTCFRYTVLLFNCMLTFGSYFVFDLPSAISSQLMEYLDIDKNMYQYFYTSYTVANFLSVVFGGFLLDRTGTRAGAVIFTAFICGGQLIWGIGGQTKSYATMIVGRCIHGLGGGSICVCQNAISTHYFKGKELAMAFGATLCMSRLGSVLNFFVAPAMERSLGVPTTIWISASICFLSILFVAGFYILDRMYSAQNHTQIASKGNKIKIKELLQFRPEYWLLCVICAIFYGCIFPFIAVSKPIVMEFGLDGYLASVCTGVVYDIALVFSIPIGILVDRVGQRLTLMVVATLLAIVSNLIMLLVQPNGTTDNSFAPWLSMVILGFAYCFTASTLWSSVSLVVRKSQVGTAMAVITAFQMLFNTIINIITGILNYSQDVYLFTAQAVLSCILVLVLGAVDIKCHRILNTRNSVGIYKDDVVDKPNESQYEARQLLGSENSGGEILEDGSKEK